METTDKIAINIAHLDLVRGGKTILNDVCATIPAGGNTVIIGPNGAGKTSLLLCLLGELAYKGEIAFSKNRVTPTKKLQLALVPQQVAIDASLPLTVCEFLALGQKRPLWFGLGNNIKQQGLCMLEMVDAQHLAKIRLGKLSGGELRRVLLASALLRRPDILLLDEAEAGMDIHGEHLLWQILDKIREELGFTQVVISHNLALAAHHASHVICLRQSVLAQGPPRTILTANLLLRLYGVPIHLYPDQCGGIQNSCPSCGAVGTPGHCFSGEDCNMMEHPTQAAPAHKK